MHEFLASLADVLVPSRCAGCQAAGFDCCPACLAAFGPPQPVQVPGVGPPVYALADYSGPARQLVLAFKERGRHTLASWFGALVAVALPMIGAPPWWLVPAPSRASAVRQRGGDHMVRIARHVRTARVAPVLRFARGVRDSVGLDALARRENLAGRVRARKTGLPPPMGTVVVLDDVVTSGATAAACVGALADVGVRVGAVLALTAPAMRDVSIGVSCSRPHG